MQNKIKLKTSIKFKFSSHRRHFINEVEKYFLSTNFKVMSSTLRATDNLEVLSGNRILLEYIKSFFCFSNYKFYLIVRNPQERLQSFFRDKFRVHPNSFGINNFEWQHPQVIILDKLGIQIKDKTNPLFKEKLLAVKYAEFIDILPQIYMQDAHLIPQNHLLDFNIGNLFMKIKPDKILKIENIEDMSFIQSILKINTEKKINFTKNQFVDFSLTNAQQQIIREIYEVDFMKFNYKFTMIS